MARTLKDRAAATDMGHRLSTLRVRYVKRHGPISNETIARLIANEYHVFMSHEQVRKFHIGEVDPSDAAIEQLVALAKFYDVGLGKVSPVAATRWERTADLLLQASPWTTARVPAAA